MGTAVFFHAHPDDESIATGGTMAKLADEGHRVVLVTATAGELGEVPEGLLAPGENLATRRAAELAEACRILGVARHVSLGFGDSGMAGESSNDRPGSFWRTDVEEAATALAMVLREEAADVVSAYDEHGGYGHPDHIQVHRVGLRAAELAGTPRVVMATINRTHFQELSARAAEFGVAVDDEELPDFEGLGLPAERITTTIDVHAQLEKKRRAMAAHASQISETSFFLSVPDEAFAAMWGTEWFVEVGAAPRGPMRTTLLPAVGDAGQDHNTPSLVAGPGETMLAFLAYLRGSVQRKVEDLSEEDARSSPLPTGTSLLGLVKHLAAVETYWVERRFAGFDTETVIDDGFALAPGDTVSSVLDEYRRAARRSDELLAGVPLETPLSRDRHGQTLTWVLVHLVEETARHAGHADIVRELLDGAAGR